MSGAYGGSAFNFSLRMIAGVGFSISPGIFSGQEGFLAATFSIGAQAGASASASYAVSGTDAEAAVNGINQIGAGLASGVAAIQAVGGIGQAILSGMFVRPVVIARASLMPSNWNLSALPSRSRAHLTMLGAVMNLSGSPDQMLAYMSRRMSSLPIQPLINEMSGDIVQALQARATTPDRIRAAYMSPQFIGGMTVLSFIRTLHEYGLLQFVRPPEAIADEMMRPAQPAAAE
ncbi:hypothetical protein GXP67_29550 [Rhodocytophaga rosea]|uniref:Uncharacterized protein n=1 Tax=Rhodocytophaga rosea TaxID=2704465 RepID=A0A6C0GSK7_9BACT|nr:hypothetical protein [Rhodocytophaga rosea]QHT70502.1 hypothetical protein GXP67_29550 [Rhodocytophaga rosea]